MRIEFDSAGYVRIVLFGCATSSCVDYTGLVPTEPEEYADMDDWADRAQVQAYYLNDQGNLAYDAEMAARLPDEDHVEFEPYTTEQAQALGIFDLIYPVGSLYMSVNNTSPAMLFGGTWEQIEDRFLLAAGSTYSGGETGGEESHKHIAPIGYESSSQFFGTLNINGNTNTFDSVGGYNTVLRDAGGTSIPSGVAAYYTETVSHIPPYLAVYVWQRVEDPAPEDYETFVDSTGEQLIDADENEIMVKVG